MPPPEDTGPLRVGDSFEEYQILGILGRGGYGCVYRARDEFMGRDVAIKVLDRSGGMTEEALARGKQEATILSGLDHPNIVKVYHARINAAGQLYIAMELLEGFTLQERFQDEGPYGVVEGLTIIEALAEGLECAHSQKIFHRDIKPANVFLCNDGKPRILDFGIAKTAGSSAYQTGPNIIVGTSLYISPEQIRGQPASHLSDIYSLGLIAFQIFHGTHPLLVSDPNINLHSAHAVWNLHIKTRAPQLNKELTDFPHYVAQLVTSCLAKDPGQRHQSAEKVAKSARAARLRFQADCVSAAGGRASYTPIEKRPKPTAILEESVQAPVETTDPSPDVQATTKMFRGDVEVDWLTHPTKKEPTAELSVPFGDESARLVETTAEVTAGPAIERNTPTRTTSVVLKTPIQNVEAARKGRASYTTGIAIMLGLSLGGGGVLGAKAWQRSHDVDHEQTNIESPISPMSNETPIPAATPLPTKGSNSAKTKAPPASHPENKEVLLMPTPKIESSSRVEGGRAPSKAKSKRTAKRHKTVKASSRPASTKSPLPKSDRFDPTELNPDASLQDDNLPTKEEPWLE